MNKVSVAAIILAAVFCAAGINEAHAFSWCFGYDPGADYSATYNENDPHFYIPMKVFLESNEKLAGAGMDIDYYGSDTDLWGFSFNMGGYWNLTGGAYEIPDGVKILGPLPVGYFKPNLNIMYGDVTFCELGIYYTDELGIERFKEFAPVNDFRIDVTGSGAPVPEPATMALFGLGAAAMSFYRRKNPA